MPEISVVESESDSEGEPAEAERSQDDSNAPFDAAKIHPCCLNLAHALPQRSFDAIVNHAASVRVVAKDAKKASSLKADGNAAYKKAEYGKAIELYSDALEYAPTSEDYNYGRAVYHCNRAACYLALGRFDEVIADCTDALELDERYLKAYTRRAQAFEAQDELDSALDDLNKAVDLDPRNAAVVSKREKLAARVQEKQEQMKAEMLDKLKGLGNTVLGKFGMSLDNFKTVQDPETGAYSISFQQ